MALSVSIVRRHRFAVCPLADPEVSGGEPSFLEGCPQSRKRRLDSLSRLGCAHRHLKRDVVAVMSDGEIEGPKGFRFQVQAGLMSA